MEGPPANIRALQFFECVSQRGDRVGSGVIVSLVFLSDFGRQIG